ncbi:transposable element Tcb2 transposase [Trichonephila clavipes]|nr:transposable element Tcb2 transposase [Trichonephila clavipes]
MANNQSVRRHLDAFTRGRIIGKLEEGRSVAGEFGIAHSIVSRLWRQFQTTGTAIRVGEIARHTTQATGRPISRFTVARRLHGGSLIARRPVRCVPLTPAHRRRRSLWCREHRNWRDNEWGRVLFTDESRFSFSSDYRRILIWRERGSRNHPSNIIERDRYGGRGVLVWGGIMLGSRTDLHIFDAGSVNGTRYCNEILPYVPYFLFMDDNAPCHRTVAAEQLLESIGLAARTLPPVTIRELRLALQDEWAAMPQQLIDTLILSMGRRCETYLPVREIISPTKDRMFLAGHPSQGCFGLQSHCAPCYFFNQASFYPSDFSFNNLVALHFKYDQARRRFVEWAPNEIAVVPDFHKRILFSDEEYFWLNGYVNKKNCRIWSEANPQVYMETPLHPEKLTVWFTLWAGGIIGPYFFKNDEGHNVTVNGDRYRAMITNFFIPELNNHDVQKLWFQQDGGYVKSLVYADKPQTLDHLEDNIRRVIADIRPQMLEKVIENWTSRLDYIRASRGSPMPEIIFKIAFAALGTLNSRRAASPLVRLVEGEETWEAPEPTQGVFPQTRGGTEAKPPCHIYGVQS